jgi:pyridoxal phosphate enzyme (YggS family)
MSIAEIINRIKSTLPATVKLVAVSKTKPVELLMEAYSTGQRAFGENKVQEMVSKYEALPKDIEWHFIGHLQSNKIKQIIPFVHLIHGVDSFKLLKTIDAEARQANRIIPCLLQFHIAEEETKFGLSLDETLEMLNSSEFKSLDHVTISGVMGMATYTDDTDQIRKEFAHLRTIFDLLKIDYFNHEAAFKEISMGMSGDYLIAVHEGSTMIRIGSIIFGERTYSMKT